jgi:hypothetical protein
MNDADFSLAELATTGSPVAELSNEHQPSRPKDRERARITEPDAPRSVLHSKSREAPTMSEVDDLRQRRQALETQLSALREQRERAFRANSVLSRQRVGVTHYDAAEMQEFAADEVAGDSAMTDLRRRIELIDDELARDHGGGLAGKGRRIMRWLRK